MLLSREMRIKEIRDTIEGTVERDNEIYGMDSEVLETKLITVQGGAQLYENERSSNPGSFLKAIKPTNHSMKWV